MSKWDVGKNIQGIKKIIVYNNLYTVHDTFEESTH